MPEPADVPGLLARHRSQIDRLVSRLVDPADRDDVTQELALAALQRPPRSPLAWPAWIATTIRNVAAKRLRGAGRLRQREQAAALPEGLPSSAELAARLDLEQVLLQAVSALPIGEREVVQLRYFEGLATPQIAAALALGESTVRARLQRAVASLRARLDAQQSGGRPAWMALLAPWSVPTFLPVVPSATVAAAALLAVAATVAWFGAATPEAGERGARAIAAPASARRAAPEQGDVAPLADAAVVPVARMRVADAEEPGAAAGPSDASADAATSAGGASAQPPSPPGELVMRCVDAATGVQLPLWTCRAVSETRLVERTVGMVGPDRFYVQPGRWSVRLSAIGFEPVVFGPFDLAPKQSHDLGAVPLVRGSGRIAGRLERRGAAAGKPAWVELLGDGRAPCPRCDPATNAAPPAPVGSPGWPPPPPESPCCGWFPERSVVPVDVAGRFAFERLAAGTYHLRPYDGMHPIQPTTEVAVACGGQSVADLVLAPPVDLVLTLREPGGAPFVGRWWPDDHAEPPPIHVDLEFETLAITLDMGVDLLALRSFEGPAPREGLGPADTLIDEWSLAESIGRGAFTFLGGELVQLADRDRAPDESLEPRRVLPAFSGCEFSVARLAPNLFRVRPLPAACCKIRLRCVDFASAPLVLDLADPANHRVEVVLEHQDEPLPPTQEGER